MQLVINGEPRDISGSETVQELLESLGMNPKQVIVQQNEHILRREDYAGAVLRDGDQLELVTFVGGG